MLLPQELPVGGNYPSFILNNYRLLNELFKNSSKLKYKYLIEPFRTGKEFGEESNIYG